jgi:hypothetical protein
LGEGEIGRGGDWERGRLGEGEIGRDKETERRRYELQKQNRTIQRIKQEIYA